PPASVRPVLVTDSPTPLLCPLSLHDALPILYNLVGCLVQILYNVVLWVWPVVNLNVVLAAIQVVNLRRLLRGRDDPTTYEVAEVPADGPPVAHLLGEHRQDVVQFQPGVESRS